MLMEARDGQPDKMAIWELLPEDLFLKTELIKRFLRKLAICRTSDRF